MFQLIRIELKKLRVAPLLAVTFLVPLLSIAFGIINFRANQAMLTDGFRSLWTQVSLFYFSFFFIPVIAILVAILYSSEHRAGFHFIRTLPVPPSRFILAKGAVAFFLVILLQFYFLLAFVLGGKFLCGLENLELSLYLAYILWSIVLAIPVIAVFSYASIRTPSLGIVLLLAAGAAISGFLLAAQNVLPPLSKLIGTGFLALAMNHFALPTAGEATQLIAFGVLETALFTFLATRALRGKQ